MSEIIKDINEIMIDTFIYLTKVYSLETTLSGKCEGLKILLSATTYFNKNTIKIYNIMNEMKLIYDNILNENKKDKKYEESKISLDFKKEIDVLHEKLDSLIDKNNVLIRVYEIHAKGDKPLCRKLNNRDTMDKQYKTLYDKLSELNYILLNGIKSTTYLPIISKKYADKKKSNPLKTLKQHKDFEELRSKAYDIIMDDPAHKKSEPKELTEIITKFSNNTDGKYSKHIETSIRNEMNSFYALMIDPEEIDIHKSDMPITRHNLYGYMRTKKLTKPSSESDKSDKSLIEYAAKKMSKKHKSKKSKKVEKHKPKKSKKPKKTKRPNTKRVRKINNKIF